MGVLCMKQKNKQKQKNKWGVKTALVFQELDLYGSVEDGGLIA